MFHPVYESEVATTRYWLVRSRISIIHSLPKSTVSLLLDEALFCPRIFMPYTCTTHVYASSNWAVLRKIFWKFEVLPGSLFLPPPKRKESLGSGPLLNMQWCKMLFWEWGGGGRHIYTMKTTRQFLKFECSMIKINMLHSEPKYNFMGFNKFIVVYNNWTKNCAAIYWKWKFWLWNNNYYLTVYLFPLRF